MIVNAPLNPVTQPLHRRSRVQVHRQLLKKIRLGKSSAAAAASTALCDTGCATSIASASPVVISGGVSGEDCFVPVWAARATGFVTCRAPPRNPGAPPPLQTLRPHRWLPVLNWGIHSGTVPRWIPSPSVIHVHHHGFVDDDPQIHHS